MRVCLLLQLLGHSNDPGLESPDSYFRGYQRGKSIIVGTISRWMNVWRYNRCFHNKSVWESFFLSTIYYLDSKDCVIYFHLCFQAKNIRNVI